MVGVVVEGAYGACGSEPRVDQGFVEGGVAVFLAERSRAAGVRRRGVAVAVVGDGDVGSQGRDLGEEVVLGEVAGGSGVAGCGAVRVHVLG